MAEKKSISIEKNKERLVSMDFKALRQHGIEWVQKLSGHIWTDYNLHDPGVTILEMLCVAITDLSYRTDFPIQDLLADHLGHIQAAKSAFFPKQDILTTNPVTTNDIRRTIRDETEGVYNVWVEPVLSRYSTDNVRGLYRVFVQMTKEAVSQPGDGEMREEQIKDQVRKSFVSKRNLCEDWVRDIIILSPVEINISAEVIVTENALSEDLLARIYSDLENYLNPPVKFYSEKDLLNEGFTIEDIYACSLLKGGFIPTDKISPRRQIIDPDEIIKVIMQQEGVINVKNLIIQTPDGSVGNKPYKLGELNFAHLANDITTAPLISIYKGRNKSPIDMGVFRDLLLKAREISRRMFVSSFHDATFNKPPEGTFRDIAHYYSIQDHFPLIYGIGEEGPSPGETEEHKAQAKQLKSYLMIFEQLLADYLSQLAHGKDLFSIDLSGWGTSTYYHQPLYQVPGAKDQLKAFTKISKERTDEEWERFKRDDKNEYARSLQNTLETNDTYRERKNRVFDHLLSRFNTVLDEFPVTLFSSLYGDPTVEHRVNEVLEWKSGILNNMVELSHDRIKAMDYLAGPEDRMYLTGFQKRIAMLLYIQNMQRRPLGWIFDLKKDSSGIPRHVHSLSSRSKKKRAHGETEDPKDSLLTGTYDFGDQTNNIFKYGIDLDNYKIAHNNEGSREYRVMYKSPEKRQWKDIGGKYEDKFSAIAAMHELVNYLKQLSIESEGFHIVEHVLLRPALRSPSYGFGFYENIRTLLFRHDQWYSFKGRENILTEISDVAGGTGNFSHLPDKIHIPDDKSGDLNHILENLRLKKEPGMRFYPRYELWVKLPDGSVIKENYFNFRMSVVFPAWPARFQENDFREFTKDLFLAYAPAHIRINFFWLDIFQMKQFEEIYFEWLNSLRKPEHGVADISLSEKLIHILQGSDYRVTGV